MPRYIFQFAQKLIDFRIPELQSIAKKNGVEIKIDDGFYNKDSPFCLADLPNDKEACNIATRSVLTKYVDRYIAHSPSYGELISIVESKSDEFNSKDQLGKKVKFKIDSYGSRITLKKRIKYINELLAFVKNANVDMETPDIIYTYYEDHFQNSENLGAVPSDANPNRVLFGTRLSKGGRDIVNVYDLKKRIYKGTTSLDAEVALIMANQALVDGSKMILDPFVGTGSITVACAHFGALTFGSDIDGRNIRGGHNMNIKANAKQYNLLSKLCDNIVCDFSHHPWKTCELFDAIVTDPPYGIREGAKRIGRNFKRRERTDGLFNNKYPQTIPYESENLITDLFKFAEIYLTVGGRLVFLMPCSSEW